MGSNNTDSWPLSRCAVLLCLLLCVSSQKKTSVSQQAMDKCHRGLRTPWEARCTEYVTAVTATVYPTLDDWCNYITWDNATADNNWGNCMEMTIDGTYRYITSNSVPNFYYNTYCPIAKGSGYCSPEEIDNDKCYFEGLVCGEDNGPGTTEYGDVWVARSQYFKIPLVGNPTRSDRPWDMYDADPVGAEKTRGPTAAVAINGISILGSNDAGDVSIDGGGFQLTCGGHVTPPIQADTKLMKYYNHHSKQIKNLEKLMSVSKLSQGPPPGPSPPMYHFHKSPECLEPFKNASVGYAAGAQPYKHAQLMAWAIDGFGVYAYQDVGGEAPIVDECGGHFGPIDTGEVVYHYHSRPIVPYHMACQGPSLSKCADTQSGANFCHPGCGADVCIQPGTDEKQLRAYLSTWNSTWLDSYTHNAYNSATQKNYIVTPSLAILAYVCLGMF